MAHDLAIRSAALWLELEMVASGFGYVALATPGVALLLVGTRQGFGDGFMALASGGVLAVAGGASFMHLILLVEARSSLVIINDAPREGLWHTRHLTACSIVTHMRPRLSSLLLSAAAAITAPVTAICAPAPAPEARTEAVNVIAELRRVVTDDGIERLEKVRIGGIDQWVSIRGSDRRNPVLLMLHGGPGWVAMPTSWYFQRGWEEYFTVVQWDQRGAGKTYAANDPEAVALTMTRERMIADTEEMIGWLRKQFGKEKIFLVGHSWGSYLGIEVTRRHPEWLHAYVGIGQISNAPESERRGWAWSLQQATKDGKAEAIADLKSVAPYAEGNAPVPLEQLFKQRKWLNYYGGMVHNRRGGDAEAAAVKLSPEYTDQDIAGMWKGNDFSMEHLLSEVLTLDMTSLKKFEVPMFLFLGRHDINVSSELAAEWFEGVEAPQKQLVWFEDSAHEVMIEEPGKTLVSLVRHLRPIAERAGDVAPE